ncbi:zinc ribbon domain-containing protein [Gracilibacillus salinarum]|uniref:Zinc ribbon domain-containing protein n=1 Tax=Gracilibacillus salinarum TaxID=2932255 RepID=A0ABY4GSG2_9BACI|nr:zinc ribbon domain-containing protein [Gracilibacillus salinarum]UOQ87156.1 zinc ribbon domain-containing protein [Gracilibacillus salinarum]
MIKILFSLGTIAIVLSVLIGIMSGHFIMFLLYTFIGIVIGMLLFAVAEIIDNQEVIMNELFAQRKLANAERKKIIQCPRCNSEYDDTRVSCPYCGAK